ncbi:MAG: DUF177 domain-containing protein [Polyangiaceae bacterium]|nr:DUF177 domain-containing protein [Polyangiaceae bacterium]
MTRDLVVKLADLESGARRYRWELSPRWLDAALDETEARAAGAGDAALEIEKTGGEVMVRGRLTAPLVMPCVRTLEPVSVGVDAEVFLLLSPAPSALRRSTAGDADRRRAPAAAAREPAGRRSRGKPAADRDLGDLDAARDTYSGEELVLDDFLREFLLLELPMAPTLGDADPVPGAAGLRGGEEPASTRAPVAPRPEGIDPRLQPLAELARRLRGAAPEAGGRDDKE